MPLQMSAVHGMKSGLLRKLLTVTIVLVLVEAVILTIASQVGLHQMSSMTDKYYNEAMNNGYRTEIKSEVQTAIAVCEDYYKHSRPAR